MSNEADNKDNATKGIMEMTLGELIGSSMNIGALMEQANVSLQKKDNMLKLELATPNEIITIERRNPLTTSTDITNNRQQRTRRNSSSIDELKPQVNELRLDDMSQKDVAVKLDISQSLVSRIERNMKANGEWKYSKNTPQSATPSTQTSTATTQVQTTEQ